MTKVQQSFLSTSSYWDERYRQQQTSWDMGQVSPPLQAYFEQLKDPHLSILIPGCGNSYEAAWLLQKGFSSITLIDIAEQLVTQLREKFAPFLGHTDPTPSPVAAAIPGRPPLQLIAGDFFGLTGQYDLIIEQTFFCALDPSLRNNYMEKMATLLKPGGKLVGLLFDRDFTGGPPFGGHREEYITLLEKNLEIKTLEPCYNSIPPRAGSELFMIAQKQNL